MQVGKGIPPIEPETVDEVAVVLSTTQWPSTPTDVLPSNIIIGVERSTIPHPLLN